MYDQCEKRNCTNYGTNREAATILCVCPAHARELDEALRNDPTWLNYVRARDDIYLVIARCQGDGVDRRENLHSLRGEEIKLAREIQTIIQEWLKK